MKGHTLVHVLYDAGQCGWIDRIAARMIRTAARGIPGSLSERLVEEWLAAVAEQRGRLRRLNFALGCWWAAMVINRDPTTPTGPAGVARTAGGNTPAYAYHPTPLFSRSVVLDARGGALCEINTTPLIDVMLVLLVTLIISLPIMTHAVTLNLPQGPVLDPPPSAEVIDLDIEFDGTVVWNGTAVASMQQLESYFRAEAQQQVQPEVHLRADRRAKYDSVAKVLASAQRNRIQKIGFADTAEFRD